MDNQPVWRVTDDAIADRRRRNDIELALLRVELDMLRRAIGMNTEREEPAVDTPQQKTVLRLVTDQPRDVLMTVSQAAENLGIHRRVMREWVAAGLKVEKQARGRYVLQSDLDAWVAQLPPGTYKAKGAAA